MKTLLLLALMIPQDPIYNPAQIENCTQSSIVGDILAHDFDGDRYPEIITTNKFLFFTPFAEVYESVKGSNFTLRNTFNGLQTFGINAQKIAIIDINNDGLDDIAFASTATQVAWNLNLSYFINLGNGNWSQEYIFTHPLSPQLVGPYGTSSPSVLLPFDVNHDGKEELIWGTHTYDILFGNSFDYISEHVISFDQITNLPSISNVYPFPAGFKTEKGDWNQDGIQDVISVDWRGDVQVMLGTNIGTFNFDNPSANPNPFAKACGDIFDLDNNGSLDAVIAYSDNPIIEYYFNGSNQRIQYQVPYYGISQIEVRDFERDNNPELIFATWAHTSSQFVKQKFLIVGNIINNAFVERERHLIPNVTYDPTQNPLSVEVPEFILTDIDQNGREDVVWKHWVNASGNVQRVYFNRVNGFIFQEHGFSNDVPNRPITFSYEGGYPFVGNNDFTLVVRGLEPSSSFLFFSSTWQLNNQVNSNLWLYPGFGNDSSLSSFIADMNGEYRCLLPGVHQIPGSIAYSQIWQYNSSLFEQIASSKRLDFAWSDH